jgi:hypothetical protein
MLSKFVAYFKTGLARLIACPSNTVAFFKAKRLVLIRAAYELSGPALVGLIWAVIALRKKDIDLYTAVSLGAAAFFFAFSMQGQFLRMDKNVRDEEHAKTTKDRLAELNRGVDDLDGLVRYLFKSLRSTKPGAPRVELSLEGLVNLLESTSFPSFFSNYRGLVLTPAFEFNWALRETATRMSLPAKASTTTLANELSEHIADRQIGERLQMLARLSDVVVRPRASGILGYIGASAVIVAFKQGIELLNSIQDGNEIEEAPWA